MKINKIREAFDSFLEKRVVPLDKRIIMAIFVLIIILPSVAFYFLFYSAKTTKIKGLENKSAKLRQEIAAAKARAAKLDEHLAEMEETRLLFAEASVLLPQKKDIPSLLTDISALGTNSGLNMSRFSPGGEKKRDFYAEIPISLNLRGPYHNIGTFLYEVSKMDRIVSATSITLGSPKMEKGEMLLTSSINLVTYRFLEASEIAPPPSAKTGRRGKKRRR